MTVPTSRWSAAASPPAAAPCLACRPAASAAELAAHFRIRHQVFVMEQGLFRNGSGGPGHDHDPHDDDPATIHVIGLADGAIGGTGRAYPLRGGGGPGEGGPPAGPPREPPPRPRAPLRGPSGPPGRAPRGPGGGGVP